MDGRRLCAIALLLAVVSVWRSAPHAIAAEPAAAKPVAAEPAARAIPADGLPPDQMGDDVTLPITEEQPLDAAAQRRRNAVAWYATGQLRESRGDFRGALRAFRQALELDPQRVVIYRAIVPLAFSLGESEEGLRLALKLVELDADDINLLQQVSRVLIAQGQVVQATTLLERAVASEEVPRGSAVYVNLHRDLGVLYAAQGKTEPAANAFAVLFDALQSPERYTLSDRERVALLANPETTYERLGQVFLNAGKSDLAVEAFEQAALARRDRPGILQYNLARVYLQAGQADKALAELDKYIDAGRIDRGRAAYDLLGEVLTALGQGDQLTARLRIIADAEPKNQNVRLVLADQLAAAGLYDGAAELYEAAIETEADATAYLGLAGIYRQRKAADELIDTLARAAVAGAPDAALQESIEAISADKELTDAVFVAAAPAAAADPPELSFVAAYLLAKLAVEAERSADAQTYFRLASRVRPDKGVELLDELGKFLLGNKQYAEAVTVYRETLDRPSVDGLARANVLFRLSLALEFAGRTDEALAAIDEAAKLAPQEPLLHYQTGLDSLPCRTLATGGGRVAEDARPLSAGHRKRAAGAVGAVGAVCRAGRQAARRAGARRHLRKRPGRRRHQQRSGLSLRRRWKEARSGGGHDSQSSGDAAGQSGLPRQPGLGAVSARPVCRGGQAVGTRGRTAGRRRCDIVGPFGRRTL